MGGEVVQVSNAKLNFAVEKLLPVSENFLTEYFQCECQQLTKITQYTCRVLEVPLIDTFHLQYMYSNLVLCSSLSVADLSLCAVMEINETSVRRHFLNATWKVIVLLL